MGLDHVFTDAIGALRQALESAMLERQAFEEGFSSDVILGDLSFETSYGLPGEGTPPRILAGVTLDWPTWSQTSYRSWYIGESPSETPTIEIEVILRIQRLREEPIPEKVLAQLPPESPKIGDKVLSRSGPTVECVYDKSLEVRGYAIEVQYAGTYELDEKALEDGAVLDGHFQAMGGWISSMLVRLGDMTHNFFPADEDEHPNRGTDWPETDIG